MEFITTFYCRDYDGDRIAALWNLMRFVRSVPDTPYMWKLTNPFMEAICEYLCLPDTDQLLGRSFLDIPVDMTSTNTVLISETALYPLYVD